MSHAYVRIRKHLYVLAAPRSCIVYIDKPICTEPIYSDLRYRIIAKLSCASTPALASTHLRLLLVDHAGSSSPTSCVIILADNHLHHQYRNIVAAVTAHGQRQTPTRSSPNSDAAQLQAENPGLIPTTSTTTTQSPSTTTTSSSSTRTLPSESQSIFICTSVHKFSSYSPFVYSDMAEKFYTDRLRKIFFAS
jgi:hypothetical protein